MERLPRAPCSDSACFGGRVSPNVCLMGSFGSSGVYTATLSSLGRSPKLLGTSTQAILGFVASVQKIFGTR